jgi:D-alanyl-D-alanine carboxypeptidase (penicillin-binding protein 5/6)
VARHARERRGPWHRTVLCSGLLTGLIAGGALVAAAAVPLAGAAPTLALVLPHVPRVTTRLRLPYPKQGQAAVGVPSFNAYFSTADETPVPIASLTKLMTAYVTLHDLPLRPSETGPYYYVTSEDVALYNEDQSTDQSSVKVVAGEVLTEQQLLEGLLIHSANNFASMLGEMVAGSDDEMVEDMNSAAASLGLRATSYVDVSGFDPASVSTAADQLRLATILMANPTFAQIVRMRSVWLPVAGIVTTFTPYLGQSGVVGVKTGYTSQAGGCDVMAYQDAVGRRDVLIVTVVLGQTSHLRPDLVAAGRAALVLAAATARHLKGFVLTLAHHTYGTLGWSDRNVRLVALSTVDLPTFTASPIHITIEEGQWSKSGAPRGDVVALATVTSGATTEVVELVTESTLSRPSLWERLR